MPLLDTALMAMVSKPQLLANEKKYINVIGKSGAQNQPDQPTRPVLSGNRLHGPGRFVEQFSNHPKRFFSPLATPPLLGTLVWRPMQRRSLQQTEENNLEAAIQLDSKQEGKTTYHLQRLEVMTSTPFD